MDINGAELTTRDGIAHLVGSHVSAALKDTGRSCGFSQAGAAVAMPLIGGTISIMQIAFDPAKDEANRVKHGVELAVAEGLEWNTAITWLDTRKDYGETLSAASATSACARPIAKR